MWFSKNSKGMRKGNNKSLYVPTSSNIVQRSQVFIPGNGTANIYRIKRLEKSLSKKYVLTSIDPENVASFLILTELQGSRLKE